MPAPRSARRAPAARRAAPLLFFGLLAITGLGLTGLGLARAAPPVARWSVYADGLNHPRGLAFDERGVLYVAEAGRAGDRRVRPNEEEAFRAGWTGRVSQIPGPGQRETLADGFPSIFSERHRDYLGPTAVAVVGGDVYLLSATGWAGEPELDNTITRIGPDGSRAIVFNYSLHTIANPPLARRSDPRADVPGGVPYGMVALNGRLYTTDGNLEFVQELSPEGQASRRLLEYPTSSHVLTGLTVGPDGALYVAEMGFWPYPPGTGQVTRVPLDGDASTFATGVTASIGAAFGPDGTLYVLEHSSPLRQAHQTGRLVRVVPGREPEVVVDGLDLPTALATGPDGNLYLSNGGNRTRPNEGQILRVEVQPQAPFGSLVDVGRRLGWLGLAGAVVLGCSLAGLLWPWRRRPRNRPPPEPSGE